MNGTRLYYERAGAARGAPLIMIHGNTLDTRMWDDQWAVFAERLLVVRYDLRGFGRSVLPTAEPYTHAADLHALLAHLALTEPVHVMGMSRGGDIALDFALAYPQQTRSVILVDTVLSGFQYTASWRYIFDTVKSAGIPAAKAAWLHDPMFAAAMEHPVVAARLKQMVEDYSFWHWAGNANPEQHPAVPNLERLPELAAPLLVLVGERDIPDFIVSAELIAQRAPHAQLVRLPGVGHVPNMEAPEMFNARVLEFLNGA